MPDVPVPPEILRTGIGGGDFEGEGADVVQFVKRFAGLRPDDRVLDVGSGLGRVTYPLSSEMTAGSYDGIDTVAAYVEWCRANLGLDPERFRFHHADVYNSFYNPAGSVRPEHFRFPWPDASFSLAIATSLFTHLSADAAANYVNEIHRVLEPGGRFFGSFFVLDGYSRIQIQLAPTNPLFKVEIEHGMTTDASNPDSAVALDSVWLLNVFQSAGFAINVFERGTWRRAPGPTLQDIVVAAKPA